MCQVADADLVWSRTVAADHLRYDWWGIQHIADFVRLMAVKQFPGAASAETAPIPLAEIRDSLQDVVAGQPEHELMRRGGAWLLDLDVIMFNQCRACPSRTGHIFSTLEQEPSCNNSPRKLKVHPVRGPNDHKWFMTPWYYPERSLVGHAGLVGVLSDTRRQEVPRLQGEFGRSAAIQGHGREELWRRTILGAVPMPT